MASTERLSELGALEGVLAGWKVSPATSPCLAASWERPARPGRYGVWPETLNVRVRELLEERGPHRPYAHQAEAIRRALEGAPVVVATPTASGKSLCMHVPVLDALTEQPASRALYLYPTKALARDQEASLATLAAALDPRLSCAVYDGDTPATARRTIRERGRIILSNPDMLHASLLPQHASWSSFFAGLRYVVLDELHSYRGVFGSHVANVLRRLRRVARFYGAEPQFLAASATIADPETHFRRLCGLAEEVCAITVNGAPQGTMHALFYNPPLLNSAMGIRASALKSANRLSTQLMSQGLTVICFCRSRLQVEVLLRYLRTSAAKLGLDEAAVQGYRGGYLPDVRRAVEKGLREGKVKAVVSTSALELGIDIGSLDACVLVGYPGSVASTWQRAGRVARRERSGAMVMIATADPVDQYVLANPESVRPGCVETARCDPNNLMILLEHLKCAAFELPLAPPGSLDGLEPELMQALTEHLIESRELLPTGRGLRYAGEPFPANRVSLRNVSRENFVVIDYGQDARVIAEVDFHGAPTYLYENAIYSVEGVLYHVDRLDWSGRRAYVRRVEPDYFTDAISHRQVNLQESWGVRPLGSGQAGYGELRVTERVVGYKKIRFQTHENVGYGEVDLPPLDLLTMGLWISLPLGQTQLPPATLVDGLRALARALRHMTAVRMMCDVRDLGRSVQVPAEGEEQATPPTLYLFDRSAGGVGLSAGAYDQLPQLLAMTGDLIRGCGCELGCPSCVGPAANGDMASGASPDIGPRRAAMTILEVLS